MATDAERASEPPRSRNALQTTDQNRRGPIGRTYHKVQHLVEAIAKVHVPNSPGSIHHLGTVGAADAGVTCQVTLPVVSLGLGDDSGLHPAVGVPPHQVLPQQPARLRDRRATLENRS